MQKNKDKKENDSSQESELLLEDGRIVNLKMYAPQEEERRKLGSPYVLNLKSEDSREEDVRKSTPNLLNLKGGQRKEQTPSISPLTCMQVRGSAERVSPRKKESAEETVPLEENEEERAPLSSKRRIAPIFPTKPTLQPQNLALPKKFINKKAVAAFLILCLFFSSLVSGTAFLQKAFNLKKGVLEKVNIAYAQLNDAQNYLQTQDLDSASSSFERASGNFSKAIDDTKQLGKAATQILEILPLPAKITMGPRLLKTGEYIANTGEYLTLSLQPFQNVSPIYEESSEITQDRDRFTFTQAIIEARNNLEQALTNTTAAETEIAEINSNRLDPDIQEKVEFLRQNIPFLKNNLQNILASTKYLLEILGHNQTKRYLLLFQNNNELRATGGFIGSYGILDLSEGQIKKLDIDGIYNPDGQLLPKISPPPPIRFTNTRWQTRDANWFPDFPTSARKIAWFFEKAGKPSVDGVIALTPPVMIELLKITGPIEMPEYDTTINADNFVLQTQKEVELEYDPKLNRPKKFLADLAPKVLNRILSTEKPEWLSLLAIFSKMLEEKHLLFYFFDQDLQQFVLNQSWGGELKESSQDYLLLVNSNINGGKTDGFIQETINLESTVHPDGSIINKVEIVRHHTGDYEWPSIKNIDYLRLYVPKGSTLLSASGDFAQVNIPSLTYEEMQYEKDPLLEEILESSKKHEESGTTITQELGKTCFGNWIVIKPQSTARVQFEYKLPFTVKSDILNDISKYTLLTQKQAGSFGSQLNFKLNLPSNLKAIWQYPDNTSSEETNITWNTVLDTDKYFGVALEKE